MTDGERKEVVLRIENLRTCFYTQGAAVKVRAEQVEIAGIGNHGHLLATYAGPDNPFLHAGRQSHDVVGLAVDPACHPSQPPDHERIVQRADVDKRLRPEIADLKDKGDIEVSAQRHARQSDRQRRVRGEDNIGPVEAPAHLRSCIRELIELEHPSPAAGGGSHIGVVVAGGDRQHTDTVDLVLAAWLLCADRKLAVVQTRSDHRHFVALAGQVAAELIRPRPGPALARGEVLMDVQYPHIRTHDSYS